MHVDNKRIALRKRLLSEADIVRKATLTPQVRGVYFLIRGDSVMYVGQSICVASRIAQHKKNRDFSRHFVIPVDSREERILLEAEYIYVFRPRWNGRYGKNGPMRMPFAAHLLSPQLRRDHDARR